MIDHSHKLLFYMVLAVLNILTIETAPSDQSLSRFMVGFNTVLYYEMPLALI